MENGTKMTIPATKKMKSPETRGVMMSIPLWHLKSEDLLHVEDDLIMLERVNDGSINFNLSQRYRKGMLYTWVGASHRVLVR
jgi:myosin heavy subunit